MKVTLRPLIPDDAKTSWKWRNDPLIWKYTINKPDRLITMEIEHKWLKNVLLKKNEQRFAICVGVDMDYIGNVQLTDITKKDAQLHIFIGERKFHSMGIGTQAIKLTIEYAFKTLDLKTIHLYVNSENRNALKLFNRCGFKIIEIKEDQFKMKIEYK
jgi:RimJ/RimL family protein N-acetyltransferase